MVMATYPANCKYTKGYMSWESNNKKLVCNAGYAMGIYGYNGYKVVSIIILINRRTVSKIPIGSYIVTWGVLFSPLWEAISASQYSD